MAGVGTFALPPADSSALRERAPELEDPLNRLFFHPLAHRLARLLRPTGLSADAVSVAGMLTCWAAAWAYAALAWPYGAAAGFALHLCWHVVDGADGDLARLKGTASPTGELVDGVCDYAGQLIIYIVLAAMLAGSIGGWAWAMAAMAGASHIAQTNHAESQRRAYLWWVYQVPWLKQAKAGRDEIFANRNWFSLGFSWMARLYLKLPNVMTPYAARIDAIAESAQSEWPRARRLRRLARRASRRSLLLQKALGPNPRTLILGASMALGSPLPYFVAEIVLLNLLLLVSIRHHNAVGRLLVEKLG